MKKGAAEKYSTYILELIRNNGITCSESKSDGENKIASCNFLFFDYFDVLYCKKLIGDDKKYVNYLSIVNVFEGEIENNVDYRVAYKTLSLYCKSGDDQINSVQGSDDFFSVQSEGKTLSETPFLGIIQISLCKNNYIGKSLQEIVDLDVDEFLKEREAWILKIADNCKPVNEEIKMRRILFRSSTTGDFCLAIRTNVIKLIYDIAIKLNGTQNDPNEKYNMLTFTNVGIECKYLEDNGYATLNADVINKNSGKIALRFSADESICEELQQYIVKEKKTVTVEGLFGRYEYLLTIGMQEFADIYPFLCECKLGRAKEGRTKKDLECILSKSIARNINERILINLDPDIMTGKNIISDELEEAKTEQKREEERNVKNRVFALNNRLLRHIKKVDKYKKFFQEEHFAFQDLIRGMIEIYKSFSSSGMDKESYINWWVFHTDMDVLCRCIREMMRNYVIWTRSAIRDENYKKWYRGIILGDWRENLNAINRYTTLVQHVNYQTYQSPSYEIQTQIDAEKEMVAYREAMELYITDAMTTLAEEGVKEEESKVYPLIYPDLSKEKVTVTAPFMVKRPDAAMTAREIICTVPSFEYFARLYDLLPWILHETSHHLRVGAREDRNRFLTDYILSYVLSEAMREPLRRLSACDFYEANGKAERYLTACMTEIAKEEIFGQDNFKKYNFEMLKLVINKWLKEMFPRGAGYDTTVQREERIRLKKQEFGFWLDAYRKEEMLDQDNLKLILRIYDDEEELAEKQEPNRKSVKQELARILLDKYYKNLEEKFGNEARHFKVCIGDMRNNVFMDEKLQSFADARGDQRLAVREYYEQIIAVYRIMKDRLVIPDENEEKAVKYFEAVFTLFQKNYKSEIAVKSTIIDTASAHIMRNLGLFQKKPDNFVSEMMKIARTVDYSQVKEQKEIRERTYLEASADILMATSLKLTGFGYCRQVLQTASDAKLIDRTYEYDDINYDRCRTVAAVLLARSAEYQKLKNDEWIEVDAAQLIEDSQTYCDYVIRHISKKLSNSKKFSLEGVDQEKNEEKRRLLRELLNKIGTQMTEYLVQSEDKIRKVLLLDILLHGDKDVTDKTIKEEWNKYKEVAALCADVRYNFWRLSCFCKGIVNIVRDGKIIVSEKLFYYMREIQGKIDGGDEKGCKWESNNRFLTDPMHDVGKFYNNPSQVFIKTPDQKLEKTIDFIQNYYYYNRFRVVNDSIEFENKKG